MQKLGSIFSKLNFKTFSQMKARTAIMVAFALTVIPVIAACVFSIYSIHKIQLASDRVEIGQQNMERLLNINRNLEKYRFNAAKLMETKDMTYAEQMKFVLKENGEYLDGVANVVMAGTLNIDKGFVERLRNGRSALLAATEDFIQNHNGEGAEVAYIAADDLVKPGGKTSNALKELAGASQKAMSEAKEDQRRAQTTAYLFTAIMLFLTIVIATVALLAIDSTILRKLKKSFDQISQSSDRLSGSSQVLTENSDGISKATGQIAAAVSQIASGANEQANAASEASRLVDSISAAIRKVSDGARIQYESVSHAGSQLNNLTSMIQQVAGSIEKVAAVASDSSTTAEKGRGAVDATISGMERIMMVSHDSSSKVQTLGEKSKQIGEIIEVIDDIAEQTNLLALNAAIEAARAGEHGRGFAVVADEVRKLAERSARATGEIADLIKGIQAETMEAVDAMEKGTQEVQSGAQLAQNAGSAIEEMLSAIQEVFAQIEGVAAAIDNMRTSASGMEMVMEEISKITDENTLATEEVNSSVESVVKAVSSIAATSEESAASAQEVAASAEQQSASVHEIAASVQELSGMATELEDLVESLNL